MAGFLSEELEKYISDHSEKTGLNEQSLRDETLKLGPPSAMMSGDSVGNFLKLIIKINNCKRILEIGTFTGYSALMMAAALPSNGKLITCDVNKETSEIAKKYWAKSPHGSKIELHIGPAIETINNLEGEFDLIFIDADKNNYSNYFEICKNRLSKNGLIIADNVLWSGKVLKPEDNQAKSIDSFNKLVNDDNEFWNTIVPIRDGLMIIKKRGK
ncbi:MAG: methyltransferase [Dehalococcoidia bacterium]|nr:methyltransferase [Dehalococcoidia bacterium]|tara:strand:+ start:378 stop:1019 length:642 start_codon:yes stop_codon:yes gene_type:complete